MNEEEAKETLKTMKENIDKKYLKTRNSLAIETVLNLIQTQQAEIEKKDKIIDLMAEWFEEWAEFIDEENYYTIFRKMSKEDIKEYFKKKVEDK